MENNNTTVYLVSRISCFDYWEKYDYEDFCESYVSTNDQGNYTYSKGDFIEDTIHVFNKKSKLIECLTSEEFKDGGFSVKAFDMDTQKEKYLFCYPENLEVSDFIPTFVYPETEAEAIKEQQEYSLKWNQCYKKLFDNFLEQLDKDI